MSVSRLGFKEPLARPCERTRVRVRTARLHIYKLNAHARAVRVANSTRRTSLTTQRALKRGRRTYRLTRTRGLTTSILDRECHASRNTYRFQLKERITTGLTGFYLYSILCSILRVELLNENLYVNLFSVTILFHNFLIKYLSGSSILKFLNSIKIKLRFRLIAGETCTKDFNVDWRIDWRFTDRRETHKT